MYIKVNGLKIYFQKTGKGKNLIMLHGWGQDVSTFWPVVDLLKDKFTLWLVDLPGFGRSDFPKQNFSISDYAKTLAEFIKTNKIKNPIILGHSFGGKVAIKFAADYPELINKLILEGSAGIKPKYNFFSSKYHAVLWKIRRFLANRKNYYNDSKKTRKLLINALKEDLTEDLKKIKAKTLIIWGEKDRAISAKTGKLMHQLVKNSKLVILPKIGHFPHIKSVNEFVYNVKDFVINK